MRCLIYTNILTLIENTYKKIYFRTREMALLLRSLVTLSKDQGSIPTWVLTFICNSSPRGSNAFFWLLGAPDMQVVQTHTGKTTYRTHILNWEILKNTHIHLHTSVDSLLETVFSRADEQYNCRVLSTGKDCDTVSVDSLSGPIAKYFTTFLKEHICCQLINKILHLVTTRMKWLRHYHLASKKKKIRGHSKESSLLYSRLWAKQDVCFQGFLHICSFNFLLLPANPMCTLVTHSVKDCHFWSCSTWFKAVAKKTELLNSWTSMDFWSSRGSGLSMLGSSFFISKQVTLY